MDEKEKQILIDKCYDNSMILEKISKLSHEQKQEIVSYKLKTRTEQELSDEWSIPKSTIHDWKTLRQHNVGEDMHISLAGILRKLKSFKIVNSNDVVLLINIKKEIEKILENRTETK